ncbi:peptidoglycan bridge formation protein FemAB [Paremcibacter congregatus]|uniref:Peptidoglycan bridge formation protein FemAB n=2 Tax=Paremcibacter congregatus TaxID=2043170 RepID=A0A2G4YUV1_9PROT|nr:FemAB family XrtA/PEP-CTERM system-associated protein [Paremcibacter congregatus]PHZ86063.1 peptidoglycan bridge formation protein FemAB [Paremcibacter congregatus]QDE27029.1 FemAB family PEP-CTERM system-associated protein [Paremcibacter congregatus]
MMQVKLLDIFGDCAAWDAYVERHSEATVYHQTAWGRAVVRSMGHKYFYIYVEDAGEIKGLIPLIQVKSRLFGNALISMAFATNGGPIFDSPEVLVLLDGECRRLSRALGVDSLECRNMKKIHDDWPTKSEMYSTFRKTLSEDSEENMMAIPRKQRAMVRKGIKFGLNAVVDDQPNRLFAMYSESVRNLGTPVFPKKLFYCLKQEYGDNCEILTIETEAGKAVSSVMTFYFRDEVVPYYGGGTVEARALAANDFMYWSLMDRAVQEKKCTIFDFGRSKNGTGAFSFKKNWGFTPEALHYEYILKDGEEIPEINPLNPKYQLMIKTWKKLPLPLANIVGPMVSRYLG